MREWSQRRVLAIALRAVDRHRPSLSSLAARLATVRGRSAVRQDAEMVWRPRSGPGGCEVVFMAAAKRKKRRGCSRRVSTYRDDCSAGQKRKHGDEGGWAVAAPRAAAEDLCFAGWCGVLVASALVHRAGGGSLWGGAGSGAVSGRVRARSKVRRWAGAEARSDQKDSRCLTPSCHIALALCLPGGRLWERSGGQSDKAALSDSDCTARDR